MNARIRIDDVLLYGPCKLTKTHMDFTALYAAKDQLDEKTIPDFVFERLKKDGLVKVILQDGKKGEAMALKAGLAPYPGLPDGVLTLNLLLGELK